MSYEHDPHAENKRLYQIKPNICAGWGHSQLQDWRDTRQILEITAESSDGSVLIRPAGTSGPVRSIQFGHLAPYIKPQPSAEPDSEGWIAWHGGECPVPDGTRVDVIYRNRQRELNQEASSGLVEGGFADRAFWHNDGFDTDIIAYRVIGPASEPADDGVLTGAALHRAIADAMDAGEGPEVFECMAPNEEHWRTPYTFQILPTMADVGRVRRKPAQPMRHLIDADGRRWEFPEPMREVPQLHSLFWVVFVSGQRGWNDDHTCHLWLAQGRCHATREARDAHERALITASGGKA